MKIVMESRMRSVGGNDLGSVVIRAETDWVSSWGEGDIGRMSASVDASTGRACTGKSIDLL